MTNGKLPKTTMTARPPGAVSSPSRSQEDVLKELERVNQITEAPARTAARALGVEHDQEEGSGVATLEAPAEVKTKGKGKTALPWEEVDDSAVISFNFKLPARLGKKLKYLGDTTYGESMTSILIDCLEPRVNKLLRERGLL